MGIARPATTCSKSPLGCRALVVLLALIPLAGHAEKPEKPLVLLELFTSEGCSSCPPADRILTSVNRTQPFPGVIVVPLSFHVDYWDRLGWTDPYGNAEYSRRQQQYATIGDRDGVYTPQMIVNGVHAFVGSNRSTLRKAVADATTRPAHSVEISVASPSSLERKITLKSPLATGDGTAMWLAVVEDGLVSEVTKGENKGKKLIHDAVVRHFQICDTSENEGDGGKGAVTLELEPSWKPSRCRVVAVVQSEKGAVLALGQSALGASE